MSRSIVRLAGFFAAAMVAAAGMPGWAQSQATVGMYPSTKDTVAKSQVTVSGGAIPKRPNDFDYYYYLGRNNGFALSPYVFTVPRPIQRVAGPTIPYSPVEYGKIVQEQLSVPSVQPSGARDITRSLVQKTTSALESGPYRLARTRVVNVADRGVVVGDTREEVRLRGLSIPSERATDDITRYYAREAMRTIQDLTAGQPVYIAFEDPLRGHDGTLLGTVYLRDGTNLNRVLLEMGLAQFVGDDFLPDQDTQELADAQESARKNKLGLWSR